MKNSRSKSQKKTSVKEEVLQDDEIDEIMQNITLKKPRNDFTQFFIQEVEKAKSKDKDKKIDFGSFAKECGKKWKNVTEKEKKKFHENYEKEKRQYRIDLEKVKHLLFKDFNGNVRRPPTAYRIFLNEKMRQGFEEDKDPKDIKKEAQKEWGSMTLDQKEVYVNKKKENDTWFEKAKKIKKVTPLSVFVQKTIETAKQKKEAIPGIKDIAPLWKKQGAKEKERYKKFADEINEERDKLRDIYEITHGVKPRRPAGAYKIFLQEKAKENKISSLAEGHELWSKLSDEEKDAYLVKSHKFQLAYKYKKMMYNKKIRKLMPKRPPTACQVFLKEKKGQKPPEGETFLSFWRAMYDKLKDGEKKKYEEKASELKKKYEEKVEEAAKRVYDMPKKPASSFRLYMADRVKELYKPNSGKTMSEIVKQIGKEWTDGKDINKKDYEKKAEKDVKRFTQELKQFEAKGFYIPLEKKESKENKEEEKPKEKSSKKSTKKSKSSESKKEKSRSKSNTKKSRSKSKAKKTKK